MRMAFGLVGLLVTVGLIMLWFAKTQAPVLKEGKKAQDQAAKADASLQPRTYKALVVDDDPDLRRIVRMTLERSDLGLTVITACSVGLNWRIRPR